MPEGLSVLMINDYRPESPRAGGAEMVMRTTQEGLGARGVRTNRWTSEDLPGHTRTAPSYLHNKAACTSLRERLAVDKPDVVHLHNFYHELSPAILRVLADWKDQSPGRRVVMTAHDFHLACPHSGLTYYAAGRPIATSAEQCRSLPYLLSRCWDRRGLAHGTLKLAQHIWSYRIRKLSRSIDLCICPSAFMAAQLRAARLPVRVLSNIAPAPIETAPRPEGPLAMVFAGRIEPEKGLLNFLRDVPDSAAWTLDVIGAGEQMKECEDAVRRRGFSSRVRWCGKLPHTEVIGRITRADVLVLPSVWPENQPLVMLEALAAGAWPLTPDLGGMREIVEESGCGTLYEPGNRESLAAAVEELAKKKADGLLSRADASQYLRSRGEKQYFESLLRIYRGET